MSQHEMLLVSKASLLQMLSICFVCGAVRGVWIKAQSGTALLLELVCSKCAITTEWWTQVLHGSLPDGNLRLSAAYFFTGSSITAALNIFRHSKVFYESIYCKFGFSHLKFREYMFTSSIFSKKNYILMKKLWKKVSSQR